VYWPPPPLSETSETSEAEVCSVCGEELDYPNDWGTGGQHFCPVLEARRNGATGSHESKPRAITPEAIHRVDADTSLPKRARETLEQAELTSPRQKRQHVHAQTDASIKTEPEAETVLPPLPWNLRSRRGSKAEIERRSMTVKPTVSHSNRERHLKGCV
jgi:NMD protein affecting ribosome stability and mRNA decay